MAVAHNPHLGDLDTFIKDNVKLVHKICQRFHLMTVDNPNLHYDDLFSLGSIGMVKAYEKFDPTKFANVNKFSTYGFPMMIGEIQRHVRDHNHVMRVSRSIRDILNKIRREELEDESIGFIAKSLGIKADDVENALKFKRVQRVRSINEELFESEGDALTLEDQLSGFGKEYLPSYDESDIWITVREELTERELSILRGRMDGYSQCDIATKLGISQVQVSRIEKKYKKRLALKLEVNLDRKASTKGEKRVGKHMTVEIRKAIKLIETTSMSYVDIAKKTGADYASVAYHGRKIKGVSSIKKNQNSEVTTRKMTDDDRASLMKPKQDTKFSKFNREQLPISTPMPPVETPIVVPEELSKIHIVIPEPLPEAHIVIPEPKVEEVFMDPADFVMPEESLSADKGVKAVMDYIVLQDEIMKTSKPVINAQEFVPVPERVPAIEPSTMKSNFSLSSQDISVDIFESEIMKVIQAMKLLGVSTVNFSLQSA